MESKNNKKSFLFIIKKIYLFIVLSFIPLTNCVIEIPLKTVKAKGIPKFKNITIQEPLDYSKIDNLNKAIILNEEGEMEYNANRLFLATIKIGSNNQQFNLVLDTGSYILWVPKLGSDDKYSIKNHYNPSKSETSICLNQYFEQKYGTGSCSGYYYSDDIKYINDKVFNINFGVADATEFEVNGGDGIIGLAHDYNRNEESYSFIHMLKKYKITDTLSFSLKLEQNQIEEEMKGKLIIGKHDDFSSNSSVTCPLKHVSTGDIFWVCEVNSVGLQNSNYYVESKIGSNYAIFDTGTNVIIIPIEYYKEFSSQISNFGCQTIKEQGTYQLLCQKKYRIDFRFKINNNVLIVPKSVGFYKVYGDIYYSKIVFSPGYFIIGSPFFVTFHTLFDKDNEKLHFYPENPTYLEKNNQYDIFSIAGIVLALIIILVIFGFIIYKCIIWQKSKREVEDFPSSNYQVYI